MGRAAARGMPPSAAPCAAQSAHPVAGMQGTRSCGWWALMALRGSKSAQLQYCSWAAGPANASYRCWPAVSWPASVPTCAQAALACPPDMLTCALLHVCDNGVYWLALRIITLDAHESGLCCWPLRYLVRHVRRGTVSSFGVQHFKQMQQRSDSSFMSACNTY